MKLKLNLSKGAEKLNAKQAQKQATQKGHILLVDDEPENLDGLEALLVSEGYEVSASTSPHEALEMVKGRPVDLIISDQRMPLMLGTELLSAVKAHREDNIRVILTGHTDMNDLITCINNGLLYRYLVKPWRAEEVLEVVEEGMKKIKIDRVRERLLPKTLWERLYEGRLEDTTPGEGRALECVAAFIDIRDFQSITSHLPPSDVFHLLSNLISALEPHLTAHHGYVAHHAGDGALLIFDRKDVCAQDAVHFARGVCGLLTEINERLSDPLSLTRGQAITLGVGMHMGRVLLGSVGSPNHLELTMLGDVVSAAARVESISRTLNTPHSSCVALASAPLVARLTDREGLTSLGAHSLLHHEPPTELFHL